MLDQKTNGKLKRVLLATPNRSERDFADRICKGQGWATIEASNGAEALVLARESQPDLIVLDLNLIDLPVSTICIKLRSENFSAPICILCERPDTMEVSLAWESGADDYLVRPLTTVGLISRLRAHSERTTEGVLNRQKNGRLEFPPLTFDFDKSQLYRYGHPVSLTKLEFHLLAALASRAGEVVPAQQLLQLIWKYGPEAPTQIINIRLRRLQRRLEGGRPVQIQILPQGNSYLFQG